MKPFTILIAEDDLLSRMILERSMVQWGYQMVSAVNGENALALLRSRSIDLCILDWDMPKVTGPEICREIRNQAGPIPYIILATSRNHPEEIQLGYEAGADDYLTKPCDMKYLRRRINTVAEKVRRQEQWLQQANQAEGKSNVAGFSPLDMYLSDLRLARRKI